MASVLQTGDFAHLPSGQSEVLMLVPRNVKEQYKTKGVRSFDLTPLEYLFVSFSYQVIRIGPFSLLLLG
jgi:hypothetical protein